MTWKILLLIIMTSLLTGCAEVETSPTATPPSPTATATLPPATATPPPTPTSTPEPTPTPPQPAEPRPVWEQALDAAWSGEGEGWTEERIQHALVPVSGQPFAQALRVQTLSAPSRTFDARVVFTAPAAIELGDALHLSFYARAIAHDPREAAAYLKVTFQPIYPIIHWNRPMDKVAPLDETWQQYHVPFVAREDHAAGEAALYFAFGFPAQTVEIGGISLYNYGQGGDIATLPESQLYNGYTWMSETYQGRELDAPWRAEAEARIAEYRQGDLTIVVQDAAGNPLEGATVALGMTQHAYGFGSAVAAKELTADTPDGERYREVVALYSKVVFENDLKYGPWEAGKTAAPTGYFVRANTFAAIDWLREHDITIRGHTLVWGPIRASGYNRAFDFEDNAEEARAALLAHVEEKLEDTRGVVPEWDIINHPVATFGDQGNRLDLVYGPEFYVDVIELGRAVSPDVVYYVNEGGILTGAGPRSKDYQAFIQYLIDNDAAPDGIGFMSHFGEGQLTAPRVLLERLDEYAEFGLKLQVTEFDIDTPDEKTQADYLRDFMTAVFSHPATEGIIMWGFWEGRHWRPAAALYRENWEIKPVGRMWAHLVRDLWWTEAVGATDAAGTFTTRGFLGDYEVAITLDDQTVTQPLYHVDREGTTIVVTME